jgi:hypothetical protein
MAEIRHFLQGATKLAPAAERGITQETTTMMRDERKQLEQIITGRKKVAKFAVQKRKAELLADVERQLATIYRSDEEAWSDLSAMAKKAVQEADAELAKRCRELGIQEEFRPSISYHWYGRGENALKERRVELRKVAATKIDVMAKTAVLEIETGALDSLSRLIESNLESADAKDFLATIPTVEALMPMVELEQIPEVRKKLRGWAAVTSLPGAA